MDGKQIFDKHYRRVATESILKSAVVGVGVCFATNLILALLYWMLAFGGVLLSILVGVGLGALTGVLLYFLKYKPTDLEVARRIDAEGLEERMITMLEFADDDSYIAERQRRDAVACLDSAPAACVKYRFSKILLVAVVVILTVSIAASVLGILASLGKIPYGKELLLGSDGTLSVEYVAAEGGRIVGDSKQSVAFGADTSLVRAVADDGWRFVGWDDGGTYPERQELRVSESAVIRALFEKIDGNDTDPDDESDAADDTPSATTKEESGGGDSNDPGGENPSDGEEGSGSGKWQDKNQFIDGATYYRDYLELYYQYAAGILDENTEIPPEVIEFFETYFNGI